MQSTCNLYGINSCTEWNACCNRSISVLFKKTWPCPIFYWSGTLLYSLIPIFTIIFLKRSILQSWTCRSNFFFDMYFSYDYVNFAPMNSCTFLKKLLGCKHRNSVESYHCMYSSCTDSFVSHRVSTLVPFVQHLITITEGSDDANISHHIYTSHNSSFISQKGRAWCQL